MNSLRKKNVAVMYTRILKKLSW